MMSAITTILILVVTFALLAGVWLVRNGPLIRPYAREIFVWLVVAQWWLMTVHHGYEAGFLRSVLPFSAVFVPTLLCIATLWLLAIDGRKANERAFRTLSALTLGWWVGIVGIFHGGLVHVVHDCILILLFQFQPVPGIDSTFASGVFFQGTGVLELPVGIWMAIAWSQLARQRAALVARAQGPASSRLSSARSQDGLAGAP